VLVTVKLGTTGNRANGSFMVVRPPPCGSPVQGNHRPDGAR
jgi:hypothetical protein